MTPLFDVIVDEVMMQNIVLLHWWPQCFELCFEIFFRTWVLGVGQ